MIRNLLLVLCAVALTLAACGRQVTPDRPGTSNSGLLPGYIQVKFTTSQALDFTGHRYVILFNTSGSGREPYPLYANAQANYRDLSFEFIVGGNGAGAVVQAIEIFRQQGVSGTVVGTQIPFPVPPNLLFVDPNSNGLGTQFSVTFDRTIFYGLVTPTPGPAASATPSPSPSASSSASPSASPAAIPTTQPQNTWFINYATTDMNGNLLDAPGIGGPQDTTFTFPVNVTTTFDQQFTVAPGSTRASDPAAQIAGGEVLNNP
ncbi:MAG: hypothetical protein ACXWNK_10275 [Vulcanimicrobiaceae bacterium]